MNVIDIVRESVEKISPSVRFIFGRDSHIVEDMERINQSTEPDSMKYPLVALHLPIVSVHNGLYSFEVVIPKITIATLADRNHTIVQKYEPSGTFKSILYPTRDRLIKNLCFNKYVINGDPGFVEYTEFDFPALYSSTSYSDLIDYIQIGELKLIINVFKSCKNVSNS